MGTALTPLKVGILVILGAVAFFIFLTFIRGWETGGGTSRYWADFSDASGLAPRSEVRIAGVPVGRVESITLAEGKARIVISIRADVPIYPNAVISKQSASFLGDYRLDLNPGFAVERGRPGYGATTEPLPPGSEIPNVEEAPSLEQLMDVMTEVASDVQQVTRALREVVIEERGSIRAIVSDLAAFSARLDEVSARSEARIDSILFNTQIVSENLRDLTSGKGEVVDEILANVRVITEQTREIVASVHGFLEEDGEGGSGLGGALAGLERAASNIESITARIDRGEGALGKLVSDEELGEQVALAVEGVSDYVGRLRALQLELSVRSKYLFRAEAAKNIVGLKVAPAPDKAFLFEVVDDPLGFIHTESVVRSPPGRDEAANQEVRTTTDTLKFSAQFARRYSFLNLRFGLIESTGGLGGDAFLFGDRATVRVDAFDLANPLQRYPRVRASVDLLLIPHLFVFGGVDNVFNGAQYDLLTGRLVLGRDAFVGGGLFFTDEDLKTLFGAAPSVRF